METQSAPNHSSDEKNLNAEFSPGSSVIYGMHGKCSIASVESRALGAESMRFYRLEKLKSALSRSTRPEPAIWVPVASARDRGLRAPMNRTEAEAALAVFATREYYFNINELWGSLQSRFESVSRTEGGVGLAKILSYLHVLKRRQIVPSPEVAKLYDSISKLLLRELSEALGETPRALEERINKGLRHKLIPDN